MIHGARGGAKPARPGPIRWSGGTRAFGGVLFAAPTGLRGRRQRPARSRPTTPMSDPLSPRAARWLSTALTLAWLAFALPRLGDYGATWDCVLGEYPAGEQYLQYLKTGDAAFLCFSRAPDNAVADSRAG